MNLDEIMNQLGGFIRERFKVPPSDPDFNEDVHLFDYGYVDSFGAVELNTFVQKTFAVEVTESDLVACPLNTVREISTFVVGRRNGKQ